MEKQEGITMEILHSLKKDKEFLVVALIVSLIANIAMAVVALVKK